MKLYNVLLAGLFVLLVSCNNHTDVISETLVSVRVHVSDFSFISESFPSASTRANESPLSYDGVKAIDLVIFSGDTPVYQTTQYKDDNSNYTTFGEFECSLPAGSYTMVTVARNMSAGDEFSITSPTQAGYTTERARETFCQVESIEATSTNSNDFSPTLRRVMAMFRLTTTDDPPSGVARLRTTYSAGSKCFNPTTGLATDNLGFWVSNSAKPLSTGNVDVFSVLFLPTDEATLDVTIEALDNNNQVLLTKKLQQVQFRRNRVTHATGKLFKEGNSSFSMSLNSEWFPDLEVTF